MHVAKRNFLAASIGSENFSLPYSLLLDYSTFEFTTLPYPNLKNHYPSGPGPWGLLHLSVPCPTVAKHSCVGPDYFGDGGEEVVYSSG